jgi:DEAD/DEAH box helicase domain-containing protein
MKLVLDLETKRSFDEVGGAHNREQLGVSVVGLYNYANDVYHCYREEDFASLSELLRAAELIIGFNLHGFDWPVLAAELGGWVLELPTLDLMLLAQKELGHRVSLNSLAKATLGLSKLGSGLDALAYYRDGDWEKLERYCLEDVKLTKDLYEYALKHGHLYFEKGLQRGLIPMRFGSNPLATLFERAAKSQSSVKMVYGAKERLVDVHTFDGLYIRGYCHLRKDERTFRLDRIASAELVASSSPLFGER